MQRWVVQVETNCTDPNREKEFNEWYAKVHLHDMLEIPGFLRATRYEAFNPVPGQTKFMTIYEVETDDLNQTMAASGEQMKRITEAGRMSNLGVVAGIRLYRQIIPPIERNKE
jgi:hypothetical protein